MLRLLLLQLPRQLQHKIAHADFDMLCYLDVVQDDKGVMPFVYLLTTLLAFGQQRPRQREDDVVVVVVIVDF